MGCRLMEPAPAALGQKGYTFNRSPFYAGPTEKDNH